MSNIKISASVLSANLLEFGNELHAVEAAGADMLHVDVMDGNFVPAISFGCNIMQAIRRKTNMYMDVHLMVKSPEQFIDEAALCGADSITIHTETATHLHALLQKIRSLGKRAGVALNPSTPLKLIDYVASDIDLLLLMTVNPGRSGQNFIMSQMRKIKEASDMKVARGLGFAIAVDGGLNQENCSQVINAGANIIVAGSAIFGQNTGNYIKTIQKLRNVKD